MNSVRRIEFQKPIKVPSNWPAGIWYTPRPLGAVQFEACSLLESLDYVRTRHPGQPVISLPTGPVSYVKIQDIKDSKHPAYKQTGLFAASNLLPDSFILLYCGMTHGSEGGTDQSNYDLSLDRENSVGIDAAEYGNEARSINDYRGIKDTGPNAEFRDVWIDLGKRIVQKGIGVFVLGVGKGKDAGRMKGIRKGDEILVSYGKGFWSHRSEGNYERSLPPPPS